jgi:mRNA interferase MazF
VNLNPVRGHEQADVRPFLILSNDRFNQGASDMVIGVPLTRTVPPQQLLKSVRIEIPKGEANLPSTSYAQADQVRAISRERLSDYFGQVRPETLETVADRLRILLDL